MRGTRARRWAQGLLLGACLVGLSACGGGGNSSDANSIEGIEQYALAVSYATTATPEPGSVCLLAIGLVVMGSRRKRLRVRVR